MPDQEKKYSPEMTTEEIKSIPNNILKQVYDMDDRVLFGSRFTRGKVAYNYIPGELMTTGRPFIVSSSISYDGKGNSDLPEGSEIKSWKELPEMFPDNQFEE